MPETQKLQKAVELTISAGYQLNKEAFEFLNMMAASKDPAEIMNRAVEKIGDMTEKPLFIDRSFLEQLMKETALVELNELPAKADIGEESEPQKPPVTEGKASFHPYAKEVDADLKVIEDPGSSLSTDGTLEDFLGYFRDRFERMEKLLRQRIDVKSAASVVDALKAQPNTVLKIIGMITEKRDSKQRIILTVEDLQANITVLVPQNATEELQKKARLLLLDQVVCLSVRKTRGGLLIAEDIIFPEVGQKTPHRSPIPVYAVLTSDMHVGSAKFRREEFNRFVLWLNGKHDNKQMKEMAGNVKYVLIAGDVVDGIGVYPNQVKELAVKDIHKQYRLAAKFIEQIPDYIEVVISPGNHDASRKALPQPPISGAYLETLQQSREVRSLGNPSLLSLHGVEVLEYHGRSLDDVISTVPGMSNNNPEKAMRLLLQSRHLAPVYGGKTTLSPESRDHLVIEHVPDIFHAGHIHALGYISHRGVLIVNSGGWQEQTGYMQRLGFVPSFGKAPVVNLQTLEVSVVSFN